MSLLPAQGEGRDYRSRYAWLLGVALGCFAILAGRLYYLQVSRGEYYARRSRSNFVKRVEIPADRGMILDSRGTILVDERPAYDVELTPAFCGDIPGTLARLVPVLGLDPAHLTRVEHRLAGAHGLERFRAVTVARDIPRNALDWVDAHRLELDGVDIRVRPQRNYRFGKTLAHALGYMNEISRSELEAAEKKGLPYHLGDAVGREGLEKRFESQLRGTDGWEQVVVDAKGRRVQAHGDEPLIPTSERMKAAIPGHNLVLSVDIRLQEAAEKAFPGRAGAVVAVDPETGYILAMVSRPSYDPNQMSSGITSRQMKALVDDPEQPMLFRAIQQQYPPGSTFKPFVALAALASGKVTPKDGIVCRGGFTLGRRRWRCWKAAGHGFMDMTHAIQHSCDTYFYWLGNKLGINPIAAMAHKFGLGELTGIGLPHEVPGLIPDEKWYDKHAPYGYQKGFALNDAIGQGDINVTPMQLVMAYSAIANGGILYKPQIVRRIENAHGKVLKRFLPVVRRRIEIKPAYLATVLKGLEMVVNQRGGTAWWRRPRHLDVMVAGKTGTAQVIRMGKKRVSDKDLAYKEKDHGWFVGFAPAEHPEIAVAVVNEHGGEGASASEPTVMKVIETYFKLKAEDQAARIPTPPPPPKGTPKTAPAPRPRQEATGHGPRATLAAEAPR